MVICLVYEGLVDSDSFGFFLDESFKIRSLDLYRRETQSAPRELRKVNRFLPSTHVRPCLNVAADAAFTLSRSRDYSDSRRTEPFDAAARSDCAPPLQSRTASRVYCFGSLGVIICAILAGRFAAGAPIIRARSSTRLSDATPHVSLLDCTA